MRGRICAAWLVLVACGRLGFERVDSQATIDATADAFAYCYDPMCTGKLTCCEPAGTRCVVDPADCQGEVGECAPVRIGCLPSELCCILTSPAYFQCVPESAGIC